jgi:hypothetical protein
MDRQEFELLQGRVREEEGKLKNLLELTEQSISTCDTVERRLRHDIGAGRLPINEREACMVELYDCVEAGEKHRKRKEELIAKSKDLRLLSEALTHLREDWLASLPNGMCYDPMRDILLAWFLVRSYELNDGITAEPFWIADLRSDESVKRADHLRERAEAERLRGVHLTARIQTDSPFGGWDDAATGTCPACSQTTVIIGLRTIGYIQLDYVKNADTQMLFSFCRHCLDFSCIAEHERPIR